MVELCAGPVENVIPLREALRAMELANRTIRLTEGDRVIEAWCLTDRRPVVRFGSVAEVGSCLDLAATSTGGVASLDLS